eukprot:jgi/Mesen1/10922/ME000095S10259
MVICMLLHNFFSAALEFKLLDLSYAYDALEPVIDEKTMLVHHTSHLKAYVTGLNKALQEHGELREKGLHELQKGAIKAGQSVLNNGGSRTAAPQGELKSKLESTFGSFDDFKHKYAEACAGVFGSGWVWLGVTKDGALSLESTQNQDNPLMEGVVLSKNAAAKGKSALVPHTRGEPIIPFMGQT